MPWAFPGWLGKGTGCPYKYPNETVTYILKWILGAKNFHNLTIDYIGVSNYTVFFLFVHFILNVLADFVIIINIFVPA